jgi:hypothetical protein
LAALSRRVFRREQRQTPARLLSRHRTLRTAITKENEMSHQLIKASAIAAAIAAVMSVSATGADAGRAKEYFSETYRFKQPMKGVEGSQGNFYCSYRNQPIFKELPNGKRIKVGYELFQHCY